MDPQEIEVDSVADLRIALDDNVDLDTIRDVAEGEMLPVPEDVVLDVAGDLGFPDASTPSQMTDSSSATAVRRQVVPQVFLIVFRVVWFLLG